MKKILIALLIVFVAIQFFRPAKNISPVIQEKTLEAVFETPRNVSSILDVSCKDCHSNNTAYPWYSNFQPVLWYLTDHVIDGKKELNFDEYADYTPRRQYHKMEEIVEVLDENKMPLTSYTRIHRDANLNAEQKSVLITWAKANMEDMKSKYPLDSLLKKK